MNKDLHDIDNLFKQSIDGHLEEVPPDVWQNIDHGLDKKQAAFYKRRYSTVRAAAIVLLLVGGVTIAAILRYHSNTKENGNETLVTDASGKGVKVNNEAGKAGKEIELKEEEAPVKSQASNDVVSPDKWAVKNNDLKEYESTENSTYSAEKSNDITPGAAKGKTYKQKETVKVKPITSVPAYDAMRQDAQPEKIKSEVSTESVSKEVASNNSRTNYVDSRALDVNQLAVNNTLPDLKVTSVIAPELNSPLSLPKKSTSPNSGSWSVSAFYGRNTNLNTLKDDEHFRDPRNNSREAKRTEQETRSYSTGLGVQKEFGQNFSVQSGLQYFSSQTTIKPKMIFAEPDARGQVRYRFNCSSGESYLPSKNGAPPTIGDSIRTNSSESSLSYLQLPLLASYRISFGKFSVLPSAGIQTNFLLSGKLTSSLVQPSGDEEVWTSIQGLRSMYFSGVIQPQLSYRFNDHISFDMYPNINFSLSPINKETAVKTYQNMFSLGAGLRVKL